MIGKIIKGVGGLYYVKTEHGITECKARGVFRKDKITPFIGDMVDISINEHGEGLIIEILERKNSLIRPPVSNIDKLFIVVSTVSPTPNTLLIDKSIAVARVKDIEPIIVITKNDLKENKELVQIYSNIGIKIFTVSSLSGEGTQKIKEELSGCVSAFMGNSGVGKSTLINAVMPNLSLQTGQTSKKLGRGRHTTRHVELFETEGGGYVADTPGFSTLDFERFEFIEAADIQYGFCEFDDYIANCKFSSCSHTCEKGCAVLEAVKEGEIGKTRIQSYIAMYNEVKDVKKWETRKNV